ncbi:hypothetical protein [Phaeovulum sp. W22_SRMD_FR3]|uniref:hypothetical protein n=1 Tax=Phaeovulum sp. W22_SRMD_FR3 TaxID=3240274 RepID=UPI003F99A4A2
MHQALETAQSAYQALSRDGALRDCGTDDGDRFLARSAEYARLLAAGRTIATLGGLNMLRHARTRLFPNDDSLSHAAARDLAHLWQGLEMYDCALPPRRVH